MDRQNPWWRGEKDPHLEEWKNSPIKWVPTLLEDLSTDGFALHFMIGPRQVGKTTLVKLLIQRELQKRDPRSIFYYSCDELVTHSELGEVLDSYTSMRDEIGIDRSLILLDEITFVDGWWRAVKARIDRGVFRNDTLIVTGSASMGLLDHIDTFPGRRGKGKDHVMHPLSFSEYCRSIGNANVITGGIGELKVNATKNRTYAEHLGRLWNRYLITGGFPRPIIDHYRDGKVSEITKRSLIDWLRGDWAKAGKSDSYMKEVIRYIFRARGTPVSWNSISSETSINSPHTARTYVEVLRDIFAVNTLDLISADGRINYRKNRKIHISDPFVHRVLSEYVNEKVDEGWLVEGVAASLLGRGRETYYFKNGTESDVVVLDDGKQIGFEITKGIKSWKKPWHLKEAFLIDRENIHLYMASI
ncbi:MAG: ATP-binding protein [Candidatus Thermoplasmatota archaeon]|nr:ATP-binding protein [Candidatus Thermoplasmatota archaeon]